MWNKLRQLASVAVFAGAVLAAPIAIAQQAPIKIGVPLPLTGALAGGGNQILWGIQYAAGEVNDSGGLFGRKIELMVEDTKGEPNTSAAIAAKLAAQDKVDAFVGGFGSTADFALLGALQRYEPIFVHAGSSSVRIEETFGKRSSIGHCDGKPIRPNSWNCGQCDFKVHTSRGRAQSASVCACLRSTCVNFGFGVT